MAGLKANLPQGGAVAQPLADRPRYLGDAVKTLRAVTTISASREGVISIKVGPVATASITWCASN